MNLFIDFSNEKDHPSIHDRYLSEDIPKHILQENKIRLNFFFLEQESVQKKGTQFIFRYAFYSVEKP